MQVISITGGKGGIGKTTIAVNLAMAYVKAKKKVLLLDADFGLANVDVMLGLNPIKNIYDVFSGNCTVNDICLEGPQGLKVLPSTSGMQTMVDLSLNQTVELIRSISTLTEDVDVMIVDLAPGISNQVIDLTQASQDILVVICNDPASLMDSYAVIKILYQKYNRNRFGIVINKVKTQTEGFGVFNMFQRTSSQFLDISLHYLGCIPEDEYISIASRERVSVIDKFSHARSAIAFHHLCRGITLWTKENTKMGGIHFFFEKYIQ